MKPNFRLRPHLPCIPTGRVLELGCGSGQDAIFLARQGFEVTAVDKSTRRLKQCRKAALERGVALNLVCADIRDFKISTETYSLISCLWCLHYISKAEANNILDSIEKGLITGGFLFAGVLLHSDGSNWNREDFAYFSPGELGAKFRTFRKVLYKEGQYKDTMHGEFHTHNYALMLAKKISKENCR